MSEGKGFGLQTTGQTVDRSAQLVYTVEVKGKLTKQTGDTQFSGTIQQPGSLRANIRQCRSPDAGLFSNLKTEERGHGLTR